MYGQLLGHCHGKNPDQTVYQEIVFWRAEAVQQLFTVFQQKKNTLAYLMCTVRLKISLFNPTALRKAKIAYNFGLSESNRVNDLIN